MADPHPIAAFNEWSCTLACISWAMERHGHPISQEEIIHRHGHLFPEWLHRPGLMERGDVLKLCNILGLPLRNFVHLNDKDESLKIVSKYYSTYLAGFVITRKPTNHCMAIVIWDGNAVRMMNPDPAKPAFLESKWDDLFQANDPDIFWLFR